MNPSKWAIKFIFSRQKSTEKQLKDAVYKEVSEKSQEILFPLSFVTRKQVKEGLLQDQDLNYLKKDTSELLSLMTPTEIETVLSRIGKFFQCKSSS